MPWHVEGDHEGDGEGDEGEAAVLWFVIVERTKRRGGKRREERESGQAVRLGTW